jgi:ABC-type antimicrobial peptide transport system permease subunit
LARRARVNGEVLRQAAGPIAAGIAAGLPLAAWASRYVASLLYGVVPLDVTSYVLAAAVLMVCGLAAALGPSNHAGRVDPMVALRAE